MVATEDLEATPWRAAVAIVEEVEVTVEALVMTAVSVPS